MQFFPPLTSSSASNMRFSRSTDTNLKIPAGPCPFYLWHYQLAPFAFAQLVGCWLAGWIVGSPLGGANEWDLRMPASTGFTIRTYIHQLLLFTSSSFPSIRDWLSRFCAIGVDEDGFWHQLATQPCCAHHMVVFTPVTPCIDLVFCQQSS